MWTVMSQATQLVGEALLYFFTLWLLRLSLEKSFV